MAILAVILYHVRGPGGTSLFNKILAHADALGWVGVDLFFVLSGYLITGILIDERTRAHYFSTFFARRVLRIVPVYVAFLLFSMWISPLLGLSTLADVAQLRGTQFWYWTYLFNVYVAINGWVAAGAGPTHLWSLAVEEQFYLIWPLVVFLLPSRALPATATGCIVAAELCRIAFVVLGAPGNVNYVLLPTRMDTLAVGAFLACADRDAGLSLMIERWRRPAILAAFAALVVPLIIEHTLDPQRPLAQIVALPAIALLSGMLVLHARRSRGFLDSSALRFVGRYSYGMYIWHATVITAVALYAPPVLLRIGASQTLLYYFSSLAAVVAATILIALCSWYLIERPFVRLKRFVTYA